MKSFLSYICSLSLFLCMALAMQDSNEKPKKEDNIPLQNNYNIEDMLISADGQSSQAYVSNQYIACKVAYFHGSGGLKLSLSSPFIMNDHPQSIQNMLFFRAVLLYEDKFPDVPQKSELLVDTIEKKTVWCFEKTENRNLNYKVYLAPFYNRMEPSLKHILKTDLIVFSPYFEKNGESYVLTWNPITSVQNIVEADKRIILFPFSGEPGTRPGVVVSPLLFYNFNGDYIEIVGRIGDGNIMAKLVYIIKDKQGKKWVLSWRKVDKKMLQEHSKYYPYETQ